MADASSKKFTFSIEALNDVLTQTKSIKKKLSPFLAKFQQFQMSQIYKTLDYLHQCMTKPKAELKYKFNSLFVLKVLLDTSNFVLVNWIEVLFLPHLVEIAKFTIGGQNTSKDYFLKQGYTAADDPEVEKFGFNYTLLATELIQVAAMMKPFKLFQCDFMETKSDFVLALQQLKKSGFKPPQKLSMYPKPQVVQGQIAKYQQGLAQIAENQQFPQIYAQYSNQKLQEYLTKRHDTQQEKYQISILQVYQSGDLYLSSQAIQICKAQISEPRSALTFENALTVFHRLMLSADYEAFYVINYEDGLYKALVDVVDCDRVERGMKRGEKFFGQFGKDSPRVYGIFLDYVQKWALFAGGFVKDDQNMLKKIVVALSETLNIELPQPNNLQQQKKRFQFNLSRNNQRSKRLSEQIQKSPSQLKQVLNHISQQSKKPQPSSIKESKKKNAIVTSSKLESSNNVSSNNLSTPAGPSEVSNNNKEHLFIQQLNMVQEVCDRFLEDEKGYEKNKAVLEKFLNNFENEIASVPEEVFNQVYERALNLQADTQEILKKGAIKQSAKKQAPQVSKTSLKPSSQVKKSSPQSQISKPVTLQTQTKIVSKQVESQTIIEGRGQPSQKSMARVETMKESKKVEDTPVKKFDIEQSERNWEKTQVKSRDVVNNQRSEVQLGYDKPVVTNENLSPAQLGYKEESAAKVETVKQLPTQKQVKFGYEQQQQQQNVSSVSSKSIKQAQKNNNNNNNGLGYEQPPNKITNQIQQNSHPLSSQGYSNNLSTKQVARQQSLGYQQPTSKSHKSIRKTQGLSQSRKHLQESSIKSNSKVQHFSPESSQFSQHELREFEKSNFNKKRYQVEELEVLEEFYEEPVFVNKPKEFKSLTGQNRERQRVSSQMIVTPEKQPLPLKSQDKLQLNERQPSQHNRSQHSQHLVLSSSPKNNLPQNIPNQPLHIPTSPANLPHSNMHIQLQPQQQQQQLQDLILDNDFINPPHISPLQQSFHDIGELQSRIKNMINNPNGLPQSNELSFKNCFETDKYILQRQEDKKTKMYWLESDTTNLVKNLLVKKERSRVSKINVPEILDERNKKYKQQLKIVEEEKNRKIKQLQGKIKHLQKQSQFFKQQAYQHAQQIRTLKANSDFDKQSVGQKGYLKDVQNIAIQQKLHSPQRFGYSGVKTFHFDTSNMKETYYFDPKGKLINSKKYKECFRQFTKEKEKKLMLKNKDLLFKDKDIEVGFMSKKENDRLIVTLYITPERDIESLTWNVQTDDGLSVESEPHSFVTYVRTKKQEKIFFTIGVNRPSFTLPVVEFTYTANEETHKFTITLPCAFHKFFHIKQSDNDLNQRFKKSQHIIRGEQVPYSKKVLKTLQSVKDYFQSMGILNKGQPNEQGEISYGGMAVYRQHQFPVRVSVKPNQFLYVQAVVEPGDEERVERQVVEYYVSTVTHLLMKEIE